MAWFCAFYWQNRISEPLDRKYLVYITVLAAWLCFCYWLYAKQIFPNIHASAGTAWPVFDEDLDLPLAFEWGSDIPHAGKGFEDWMKNIKRADSLGNIIIMKGYYYRDEASTIEKGRLLAKKRADRMVKYLELPHDYTLIEIIPGQISSDVRSHPFKAIDFEDIRIADMIISSTDTIEICYPFKDSIRLAQIEIQRVSGWLQKHIGRKGEKIHIVGTADGTGISESSDIAWERALAVKKIILQNGWEEYQINLSTGQRNHPEPIRNRCVIIYFE